MSSLEQHPTVNGIDTAALNVVSTIAIEVTSSAPEADIAAAVRGCM